MVFVLKKYGGLGLGLETQSLGLGLGLDKKVLFTSLPNGVKSFISDQSDGQKSHINIAPECADNNKKASHGKHVACPYSCCATRILIQDE